jgi:hypothetical protein
MPYLDLDLFKWRFKINTQTELWLVPFGSPLDFLV